MPIYEYRCQACGHEMEKLQKLSDAPLLDCPACGESALVKLVSAAGFRLKGAGWYETDFKKDGKRNLAGESDKAAKEGAKDAAGSDKSGDKKPEAKAEKQKPKPSGEKAA